MNLPSHTKGSIMGLVLTVTMLVTLMSAFFILRSGLDAKIFYTYENNDRLLNNARSGLQLLLAPGNPVPLNGVLTLDLFDEGNDSVYLERKSWGVFEVVVSKAFSQNRSIVKKAMIGARPDTLPLTLYVTDMEKPISVCGTTRLAGKCYVPASGFKRAYIEGQNYQGDRYVYGTQLNSAQQLPVPNPFLVETIQQQLKQPIRDSDSVIAFQSISTDTVFQSFDKKTLVLESFTSIHTGSLVITGNIKIIAPKIHVSASSFLSGILLVADEVTLEDKCKGEFQVFARKRITTGKEVELFYPSVLVVCDNSVNAVETGNNDPQLYLGEKSIITGDLIVLKEKNYRSTEAWLSLDKETTINGNVYVNGKLDVKGKIFGTTYCDRFFLKTSSGIYENHLLNAELDAGKLPKFYTGAQIMKTGTKREVLIWL